MLDIRIILERPKESNRYYFDEVLGLHRKYNQDGDKFGSHTIEGLG